MGVVVGDILDRGEISLGEIKRQEKCIWKEKIIKYNS